MVKKRTATSMLTFFFTENYNDKIFLAHLRTRDLKKSQIAADIDEQIALFQTSKNENKIIFILDKTTENWHSDLKTRFPNFDFKILKV